MKSHVFATTLLLTVATGFSFILSPTNVRADNPQYWTANAPDTNHRVDVTADLNLKRAIQQLVDNTTILAKLGTGGDTRFGAKQGQKPYNRLIVEKIYRLEDPSFWNLYNARRQLIKRDHAAKIGRKKLISSEIESNLASRWYRTGITKEHMNVDFTVNETYLFHGTESGKVKLIDANGVDESYSKLDGLFGAGNYFTEKASKADQYATPYGPGRDEGLFPMFLARVTLGNYLGGCGVDFGDDSKPVMPTMWQRSGTKIGTVTKKGASSTFIRNTKCVTDLGWVKAGNPAQSLIGAGKGSNDGFEFVVYKGSQAYMEYLILYKRVQANAWKFLKNAAGHGLNKTRIFSLEENGFIWKKDLKSSPKGGIKFSDIDKVNLLDEGKTMEIKYNKKIGTRTNVILKVCKDKGCSSIEDMRYLAQAIREKSNLD